MSPLFRDNENIECSRRDSNPGPRRERAKYLASVLQELISIIIFDLLKTLLLSGVLRSKNLCEKLKYLKFTTNIMEINETIFKELIRRGYSIRGDTRVWDISDSKLWFLTPELSKGFVAVKDQMSPYKKHVIEPEMKLLGENAKKLVELLGKNKFNLIDMGCGTGGRAKLLIENMPSNVKLRYCPVAMNNYFINSSSEKVKPLTDKVSEVKPFISDFSDFDVIVGLIKGGEFQDNLVMMLGSRISHYEINEILFRLSSGMFKGDILVIGNGIREGERFVDLEKYRSPLFNEWFIHIMRGIDFKDDEAEYDARFENYRVEGFYRVKVDKTVEQKGRKIQFKKGDEIVVAVQYKFYENELKDFCKMYFCDIEVIKDSDSGYALFVCRK